MQSLLQQREAECKQVAAQNITLQIKVDELHGKQNTLCLAMILSVCHGGSYSPLVLSKCLYVSMPAMRDSRWWRSVTCR